MTSQLNWTEKKPTVPGYYWVRYPAPRSTSGYAKPRVLEFRESREHAATGMGHRLEPTSGAFSTAGIALFAGPLPEPGDVCLGCMSISRFASQAVELAKEIMALRSFLQGDHPPDLCRGDVEARLEAITPQFTHACNNLESCLVRHIPPDISRCAPGE